MLVPPRSRAETARLFEQVALVMGKIGLINGEAERQDQAC